MRYRVRQGYTFGADNQHTAGAIVELQEHEAAAFLDKLEPAEEGETAPSLDTVSSEVTPEPEPKPQRKGRKE